MANQKRAAAAILMGGLTMFLYSGCQRLPEASATVKSAPESADGVPSEKTGNFAEDRQPELQTVPFDGKRAMAYLNDLCNLGPRLSGTEAMKRQQDLLKKHFEKLGATVVFQTFEGKQPSQAGPTPMANMIITWNPEAKRRIILCGHYDTRPIADQEPSEREWHKPFLSANDGTSTVAFLMELGNHVKAIPLKVGIDFVIFDGEEFIHDPKRDRFFLGSEHFASQYRKAEPEYRYLAAILLDLFAAKDAKFKVEMNSWFQARELLESVWREATIQGVESFLREEGPTVSDDHLALNRVGIPAIDIIDFHYRHWHRLSDLPEQCSGEKMAEVAKVLVAWMQRLR